MTLHTYFNFFKLRANLSFNSFPRIEKKEKKPTKFKKTCTMQKIKKKKNKYTLILVQKKLVLCKIFKKKKEKGNKYTLIEA
jgi:hypothetical protein